MTVGYNGEICLLLESNFLCNFKLICPVQSPGQKESTLLVGQIITTSPPRPAPLPRGASPSSRNVGRGMRWTLQLKRRMSLKRTAKPRGPGAPWLASSWRRCFCIAPMTVTNTSRTPGRARRKPLKPIACGNAGYLRWMVTTLVSSLTSDARLRVPSRTRHSPRPRKGADRLKARAYCAARSRSRDEIGCLTTESG